LIYAGYMSSVLPNSRIALEPYLARIGYVGDLQPTPSTLERLHLAHAIAIPFENLDILLGRGIQLDLESLQRKLVANRRGGYCFEQNLLFASVLEDLGFDVTMLSARVRYGATVVRPRTHMLLLVTFAEERWIADVGFGGEGLLRPVRFVAGEESTQFRWIYRIVEEGRHHVLQSKRADGWMDMYAFTLEPHERVDYEVANHFTSTYPTSPFRLLPIAQRPSPEARYILRGRELTIETESITTRTIQDDELLDVLRETFGIELPPGTAL
jgi:N-hydroxyarylamine O-acetyltransferase